MREVRPAAASAPAQYPVVAALVDLEEGIRLVSNLVGADRDDIRIGMAVEAEFVETEGGHRIPVFRAVDA